MCECVCVVVVFGCVHVCLCVACGCVDMCTHLCQCIQNGGYKPTSLQVCTSTCISVITQVQ